MTTVLIVGFLLLLVATAVMSSRFAQTKKRAVADLEKDQEAVGHFDIHELVDSEVADLNLSDIAGAEGLPNGVLLKAWSDGTDVVAACSDQAELRFVLRDGVAAADATETDVRLERRS